jgi:hypothetical protein
MLKPDSASAVIAIPMHDAGALAAIEFNRR